MTAATAVMDEPGLALSHTETTLTGAGGLRLQAERWAAPDVAPRGAVVLVHGYGEHLGRYAHVVAALCRAGYTVFGVDHRGHGRSDGRRAATRRFDLFVDDLDLLVALAHADGPLPVFLLGHSMGGLIATRCALRRDDLAGLVVSGAAFKIGGEISRARRRVSALLARLLPDLPIVPGSPPGILSRDPEVERRFGEDPLTYRGKVRAGMAYGMFAAGEDARTRASSLALPLLVMHGADDTLTDPAGSVAVYEAARGPDKTLTLWPGLRHEIFNEPEGPEVIAAVVAWLDART